MASRHGLTHTSKGTDPLAAGWSENLALDPSGDRLPAAGPMLAQVFELFPDGIMVVDRAGTVVAWNRALTEVLALGEAAPTCCELLACREQRGLLAGDCLTELAVVAGRRLGEVRVETPRSTVGPLWVTAAPLYHDGSRVVFHIRPVESHDRYPPLVRQEGAAAPPSPASGPRLWVRTLGTTSVHGDDGPIGGDWLEQRAGALFEYLVCERRRTVPVDEIAETLWPGAGSTAVGTVRYFVHILRERLEPDRPRGGSAFVIAHVGGYRLNREAVDVDADEFERLVRRGLDLYADGEWRAAEAQLERALELHRGDFLADAPYAEWAFAERERLRDLVERPLRALADIRLWVNDLDGAIAHLERVARMEPFDEDIQRLLIGLWLRQGRRSRAMRQYQVFEKRLQRQFAESPSFRFSELLGQQP